MLQDCKELKRENSMIRGILKGEEEGAVDAYCSGKWRRKKAQDEGRSQNESSNLELTVPETHSTCNPILRTKGKK